VEINQSHLAGGVRAGVSGVPGKVIEIAAGATAADPVGLRLPS
jgi:hypothetical protein